MSAALFDEAQAAIQRGERIHARKLLRSLLMTDPRDEQAWLLMARVVDTHEQVMDCLARAAKINPQNLVTARALEALRHPHPVHVQALAEPTSRTETVQVQAGSQTLAVRQAAGKEAVQSLTAAVSAELATAPVVGVPALQAAPRAEAGVRKTTWLPKKETTVRPPRRYVNWSLMIGAALVFIVAFLSVLGPKLAMGDPLEENVIIKVGDTWVKPPFKPFEVPGFPLGSDQFGRDLFSRILYAIQPTMIMVTVVSLVRLFLGTVIGLGAGWSTRRTGRLLDILISMALAVPVFMIALGVIAMLGAVGGNLLALATALKAPQSILAILKDASSSTIDQMLPFLVGLSITGWGETARIVREQTQAVRGQLYIEAAHAMGASSWRILKQHVLRQIMSMVWMLFAFEISSTLMVTAGLGFLGYYIGGDVWIEVADFVSRRVSGTPELGQMLATSWSSLTEPWPMVLTGTIIFLAVLGFNLLGDGLRLRLNPENINRNSLFARARRAFNIWSEEYITYPIGNWLRQHSRAAALVGLLLVMLIAGGIWLRAKFIAPEEATGQTLSAAGGHLWSGERGDPYGTRNRSVTGLQEPTILWQYKDEQGFANGLAISKEGIIYLGSLQKKLLAFNPDGTILWEVSLVDTPLGSPALGLDGTIYITDIAGGLTAFSEQGEQLWHYTPTVRGKPTHGAICTEDGTIYYLLEDPQRGDTLIAMNEDSSLRWSVATGTKTADTALRLSPDGEEIYVKNKAFSTETGELLIRNLPSAEDPLLGGQEQLFIGADQQRYMQVGHNVMRWKPQGGDFSLLQSIEWNYESVGFNQYSSYPADVGVSSDQKIWLFYSWQYGQTTIIWLEPAGEVIGVTQMPLTKNSVVAGIDGENVAYICGIEPDIGNRPPPECLAFQRGNVQPRWQIELDGSVTEVSTAAVVEGRLYVVTRDGFLFVVSERQPATGEQAQPVESSQPTDQASEPPAEIEETPAVVGELLWTYQFPGAIGGGPHPLQDGSLIVLTVDNVLIKIDEGGQLINQIMVEPGPYRHPEGRFIIEPIDLGDGRYLVVSVEKTVYTMDAEGTKLWEAPLEADPVGPTAQRGDIIYLADQAGNLYAFGAQGLLWQVKPNGATKAANRPAIGPDGRIYYVVVINRRAYVQSVNPDGTLGWQVLVKTGFFNNDLQINGAGTLLFLRDDIFDIQAGVRLELVPPIRPDEYIMGEDGLTYLRSGHVVSQWELGADGMKIVKSVLWDYSHMGPAPFMSFVTAQKVIWLYYGLDLIWLDMDGNILNSIELDYGVQWWDRENTRYYTCTHSAPNEILNCKMYAAGSVGPVWEMLVSAVPGTQWGWIVKDGLFGITPDNLLYRVKVDWPEE